MEILLPCFDLPSSRTRYETTNVDLNIRFAASCFTADRPNPLPVEQSPTYAMLILLSTTIFESFWLWRCARSPPFGTGKFRTGAVRWMRLLDTTNLIGRFTNSLS